MLEFLTVTVKARTDHKSFLSFTIHRVFSVLGRQTCNATRGILIAALSALHIPTNVKHSDMLIFKNQRHGCNVGYVTL